MIFEEPYFLSNPEWYYHDEADGRYHLTEKAPQKAKESYDEFYDPIWDHGGILKLI